MRQVLIVAALAASVSCISVVSHQANAAISAGPIVPVEEMQTTNPGSFMTAWSIRGAAKKVGKPAKSVGKKAGKAIGKANKAIVPSEIRNAASKAANGIRKAGRFVAEHPYGRRCKPDKYLRPVCTVKGTGPMTRDHRSLRRNTVAPARSGRSTGPVVRDHRKIEAAPEIRDHRTKRGNTIAPARAGQS